MTKVWAHRGASAYAPENTLAAFQLARDLKADGVELDVQLSSDGELVVIHDERLERTTDGTGWVKDFTLEQLQQLDASMGSSDFPGQRIPTLAEVFDVLSGSDMTVNIELKDSEVFYEGIAEKVLQLVDERNWEYRTVLSSFNHLTLARIRQMGSLVYTGVLFSNVLYEPWDYAHQLWATALHPDFRFIDLADDFIKRSHDSLLEVNAWTVNEVADIDHMLDLGVNGIITNYPDRALERVAAHG